MTTFSSHEITNAENIGEHTSFLFVFSCESIITRLNGHQLTTEYLTNNGFTRPILITNRDGLDLSLPDRTITLAEINELVGKSGK
jgi:hypothetical protein